MTYLCITPSGSTGLARTGVTVSAATPPRFTFHAPGLGRVDVRDEVPGSRVPLNLPGALLITCLRGPEQALHGTVTLEVTPDPGVDDPCGVLEAAVDAITAILDGAPLFTVAPGDRYTLTPAGHAALTGGGVR